MVHSTPNDWAGQLDCFCPYDYFWSPAVPRAADEGGIKSHYAYCMKKWCAGKDEIGGRRDWTDALGHSWRGGLCTACSYYDQALGNEGCYWDTNKGDCNCYIDLCGINGECPD